MLETTLATTFTPGTNIKGSAAGANWSFLLPSLELERIAYFGLPTDAALESLARIGRSVTIACRSRRQLRRAEEVKRRSGLANVELIAWGGRDAAPLPAASVDLAVVPDGGELRRLRGDRGRSAMLERLLKPDGLVYVESGGPVDRLPGRDPIKLGVNLLETPRLYWLAPFRGEIQAAVPASDHSTIAYFHRHAIHGPSFGLRLLERPERFISGNRTLSRLIRRRAALAGKRTTGSIDSPPEYVLAVAQAAGIDLDGRRWGLSTRGKYNSKKVVLFVFDHASESPEHVVKITRHPAFNPRLENECRALALLHEKEIGSPATLPQVVFFGHHGHVAILGETAITGAPFRLRMRPTADCPSLRAAVGWLLELGAATADPETATPEAVAGGLETLFEQFVQIYRLEPSRREFLADQIAAVARSRAPFPLVFQHGDPGTWNLKVTPTGDVAFLDWEAAEPRGMPLWDLFYFMRSFAVSASRSAGPRDPIEGFARQYLADSELSRLLIETTARYCERSGLSNDLVEPLFHTCWMHRALKEATRLSPDALDGGHYVNLLRTCIEQRGVPALQRLFSVGAV